MSNRTPGSWKAARVFGNNAPDSFKVFTKPFGGVCVADCGDNEENAKLCAAGPEMITAIRRALPWIGKMIADGGHMNSVLPNDAVRTMEMLDSVCKKLGYKD